VLCILHRQTCIYLYCTHIYIIQVFYIHMCGAAIHVYVFSVSNAQNCA